MQNWPHDLLRFLIADPGCIYLSFDLSQAENRIVAYVGRVLEMIRCFEEGIDVHSLVGANIANRALGTSLTWKDIKQQEKEGIFCPIGDGTKTWRFYGKRSGHASNYDMGFRTFALKNELRENDAKFLLDSYHRLFPEIRANYQELIKAMLLESRTITNLYGRNRTFMDEWGDTLFKDAYAQLPQSTVADKINEDGLEYIYYNQPLFAPVDLLCQVHDSEGMQIPLTTPWPEIAQMLLLMKRKLETPLSWHDRSFSIPADLTIGMNLCKETIKDDEGNIISMAAELKSKEIPDDPVLFGRKLEECWTTIQRAVRK